MSLLEWLIITAIVAIIAVLVWQVPAQERKYKEFMENCTQYEPKYACEVKWKQMYPERYEWRTK